MTNQKNTIITISNKQKHCNNKKQAHHNKRIRHLFSRKQRLHLAAHSELRQLVTRSSYEFSKVSSMLILHTESGSELPPENC